MSRAQKDVIDTMKSDPDSYIIRNDFLGRSYHIKRSSGMMIKLKHSTVSSLFSGNHIRIDNQPTSLTWHIVLTDIHR
jgi:hypothetical protein